MRSNISRFSEDCRFDVTAPSTIDARIGSTLKYVESPTTSIIVPRAEGSMRSLSLVLDATLCRMNPATIPMSMEPAICMTGTARVPTSEGVAWVIIALANTLANPYIRRASASSSATIESVVVVTGPRALYSPRTL